MTTWDRHLREEKPQQRRKKPSFSSSLLDTIYHSIDETKGEVQRKQDFSRRDNALRVEEEITSIRKAIMIEKWMENYEKFTNSASGQNNSIMFSSSATESAARSTPKSSAFAARKLKNAYKLSTDETSPRCEGTFTRTKSRALKIYGDLKKVKQPISPGRKLASFLNSIFSSRNMKKHHQAMEDWSNSLRKSRSVKESTTCSFTSRSCLSKAPLPRSKTKRSVTFGPVCTVIVGEHHPSLTTSMPNISSHFIMENINSLQNHEETKPKKYESDDDNDDEDEYDDDDKSCTSSDLFELENISIVGNGMHKEDLPVYGTTSLKINQAIAIGLFV